MGRFHYQKGQEFTSLQHRDAHEEETKCLIVVSAVNSFHGVYYRNGSRIYFFHGHEEETKCLIVVLAVNSMGRSLLPKG
jgi:hypothetical protein